MKLTISAHLGQPIEQSQSAVFPPRGGSLGHRSDNTLVLEDRHGTIAGRHAIFYQGLQGWRVAPEPGATVAVNGHSVGHGQEWPVQIGDVLEIGPYVLTPAEEHSAWSGLSAGEPALGAPPEPASAQPHPLQAGQGRAHHLDDPLATVDDKTTLDELQGTPIDPLALFGTHLAGGSGPSLEDPLLAGFDQGLPAEPAPVHFGPSIADSTPEFAGHLRMQIQWPEDTPAQAPGTVPQTSSSAAAEALIQAFREGLGQSPQTSWPGPDFMRLLGATLRALQTQLP